MCAEADNNSLLLTDFNFMCDNKHIVGTGGGDGGKKGVSHLLLHLTG